MTFLDNFNITRLNKIQLKGSVSWDWDGPKLVLDDTGKSLWREQFGS